MNINISIEWPGWMDEFILWMNKYIYERMNILDEWMDEYINLSNEWMNKYKYI